MVHDLSVASLVSTFGLLRAAYERLRPRSKDELILQRWNQLVRAFGLGNAEALAIVGQSTTSVARLVRANGRADVNLKALKKFCRLVGVRTDWALGHDDRIYDSTCLNRDPRGFVEELNAWKRKGEGHTLLVYRSGRQEIEDDLYQTGALALRRTVMEIGDREICEFRPVDSLREWGNEKQLSLALRAMFCAYNLRVRLVGKIASERECEAIAEGKRLPTPTDSSARCHWHPDDYVRRPSRVAKGGDWIDGFASDQWLKELLAG